MKKLTLKQLVKLADELNALLFDVKKKKKGWIDTDLDAKTLEVKILKASTLMVKNDKLTKAAQTTLDTLKAHQNEGDKTSKKKTDKKVKETDEEEKENNEEEEEEEENNEEEEEEEESNEEEEEEEEEPDLQSMVEEATGLGDLKKIAKKDDSFKSIRNGIGKEKDLKALRKKMLTILKEEQTDPPKELTKKEKKAKEKKEKTEKPTTEKKTKKVAFNRIEAGCLALQKKPKTFADWCTKTDEIMVKNGGSENEQETKAQNIKIWRMSLHFDLGIKVPNPKK